MHRPRSGATLSRAALVLGMLAARPLSAQAPLRELSPPPRASHALAGEAETPGPYGARETWSSRDKLYHFAVSAAGAAGLYSGLRALGLKRWPAIGLAALTAGVVGVYREVEDERHPGKYFSEKDLLWNAAGIAVGIWIPDRFLFRRGHPTR